MSTQTSKRQKSPTSAGRAPELETVLSPRLFKALGEPNRIAILEQLARCCDPKSVSEMASCCPVDISVVSRHLATLREAGILAAKKTGKEVRYALRADVLARTLRQIADSIEQCCGQAGRKARARCPAKPKAKR